MSSPTPLGTTGDRQRNGHILLAILVVLGSAITLPRRQGFLWRQLVQERRGWHKRVKFGDTLLLPWIGVQKTVEARRGNMVLSAMSNQVVFKMSPHHPEVSQEPWGMICWRSATRIVRGTRMATLERAQATVTWH